MVQVVMLVVGGAAVVLGIVEVRMLFQIVVACTFEF